MTFWESLVENIQYSFLIASILNCYGPKLVSIVIDILKITVELSWVPLLMDNVNIIHNNMILYIFKNN